MTLTQRTKLLAGALALFAGLFAAQNARCDSIQKVEGVNNFGRITDTLYRGAQPSSAGFAALHHLGVSIVVNFRNDGEAAKEKGQVEALGMKYVSIPWSGRDEPNNAQIVQFLDLVRDNPNTKIFIHCQRGADRTGTMAAAYRVAVEHKSVNDAIAEMHQYHYAHFMLPHLQRYVNALPQQLQSNAQFAEYAPASSAPRDSRASIAVPATIISPIASAAVASAVR